MLSMQDNTVVTTLFQIPLNTTNIELAERLLEAESAWDHCDFEEATNLFAEALSETSGNAYVSQRLACSVYKSQLPNHTEALVKAESILKSISYEPDAETLGLLGSIQKQFFSITNNNQHLENSLSFYEKGFFDQADYYNGVNTAFMYLLKSNRQADKLGSVAYFDHCTETWKEIIKMCITIIENPNFDERNDKHWVYQSLSQAYYGLGKKVEYDETSKMVIELSKGFADLQTFFDQNQQIMLELDAFKKKHAA
jgi:hypothetical protein